MSVINPSLSVPQPSHGWVALLLHVLSQTYRRWLALPETWQLAELSESKEWRLEGETFWRERVQELIAAGFWPAGVNRKTSPGTSFLRGLSVTHVVKNLQAELQRCADPLAGPYSIVTYYDANYPDLLRQIIDPPAAIFCCGNLQALERPCVGLIGSRKASRYASKLAYDVAVMLADRGYQVVSGGAYGCDAAAHWGTLGTSIDPVPTTAVMAGGLETLYPRGNRHLFEQIRVRQGLFLSERLWHASCRPYDFPIRNRIIAGLSLGTIVVQAAKKSGAISTANLALQQGREVVVVDSPGLDIRFEGNRQLIDAGAPMASTPMDLVACLV